MEERHGGLAAGRVVAEGLTIGGTEESKQRMEENGTPVEMVCV